MRDSLNVLAANIPSSSTVLITDASGLVVADVPGVVEPGYDVSERPWFKEAAASREFIVSPVFKSVLTGRYLSTISVPIRVGGRPDGQLLGVIAISQGLTGYQDFVDNFQRDRGVRLSIIDGAGSMVADAGHRTTLLNATIEQRQAFARAVLNPDDSQIQAMSAVPAEIGNGGWRMVSQEETATALRPAAVFTAVATPPPR